MGHGNIFANTLWDYIGIASFQNEAVMTSAESKVDMIVAESAQDMRALLNQAIAEEAPISPPSPDSHLSHG